MQLEIRSFCLRFEPWNFGGARLSLVRIRGRVLQVFKALEPSLRICVLELGCCCNLQAIGKKLQPVGGQILSGTSALSC